MIKFVMMLTVALSVMALTVHGQAVQAESASPVAAVNHVAGQIDVNKDGNMDLAELQAQRQGRFDAMDINKDGALSSEEFLVGARAMDINKDGVITSDEWFVFFSGKPRGLEDQSSVGQNAAVDKKHWLQKRDINGDQQVSGDEHMSYVIERFEAIDANGDEQITVEESSATAGKRFSELDVNGDGSVTIKEFMMIVVPSEPAQPAE